MAKLLNNILLKDLQQRAGDLKRIAIVGMPGSGKSTLTSLLAQQLQLPAFHLDVYYWKPGWQEVTFEKFAQKHDELILQELWIIDGLCGRTYRERFERADLIVFLDLPWRICAWRVIKRMIQFYDKRRSENVPEGCHERIDKKFLSYVWHWPNDHGRRLKETLQSYTEKTLSIKNIDEIAHLINSLS